MSFLHTVACMATLSLGLISLPAWSAEPELRIKSYGEDSVKIALDPRSKTKIYSGLDHRPILFFDGGSADKHARPSHLKYGEWRFSIILKDNSVREGILRFTPVVIPDIQTPRFGSLAVSYKFQGEKDFSLAWGANYGDSLEFLLSHDDTFYILSLENTSDDTNLMLGIVAYYDAGTIHTKPAKSTWISDDHKLTVEPIVINQNLPAYTDEADNETCGQETDRYVRNTSFGTSKGLQIHNGDPKNYVLFYRPLSGWISVIPAVDQGITGGIAFGSRGIYCNADNLWIFLTPSKTTYLSFEPFSLSRHPAEKPAWSLDFYQERSTSK